MVLLIRCVLNKLTITVLYLEEVYLLQYGWIMYIARVVKADWPLAIMVDMEMSSMLILRILVWSVPILSLVSEILMRFIIIVSAPSLYTCEKHPYMPTVCMDQKFEQYGFSLLKHASCVHTNHLTLYAWYS